MTNLAEHTEWKGATLCAIYITTNFPLHHFKWEMDISVPHKWAVCPGKLTAAPAIKCQSHIR